MPIKAASSRLGKQGYTLESLARRLEPRAYEEWKTERQDRVRNSFPGAVERHEFPAYLADLRYGTDFSWMTREERRFNDLTDRIRRAVRDVIASTDACTEGVRPDGSLGEVPRTIAQQLKIDFDNNTLSTPDGGVVWRAVIVREVVDIAPAAKSESRGEALHQRIRKWHRSAFPNGTARTWDEQATECAKALGLRSLHQRTLRRALKGK
jgi:hypothetical protein